MSAARIVKAVDVFKDRHFSLAPRFPGMPPDQLCLDRFEERFDGSIVVTIAFAAHRHLEAVLAQDLLIIMRTILAAAIRVVDAVFGR